jgi:hypothetical protein
MTRLAWLADKVVSAICWLALVTVLASFIAVLQAVGVAVGWALGFPTICGGL